jgi:hypothetical protein
MTLTTKAVSSRTVLISAGPLRSFLQGGTH